MSTSSPPPAEVDAVLAPPARPWKRKKLTMEVNKCEDRQWGDYKEAVYPLLRDLGFFT